MPEPTTEEAFAAGRASGLRSAASHARSRSVDNWGAASSSPSTILCTVSDELFAQAAQAATVPASSPGPRYFLRLTGGPEREATKEEFVSAERAAGFRNTMGQPDEPATSGFVGHGVRGRIEFPR